MCSSSKLQNTHIRNNNLNQIRLVVRLVSQSMHIPIKFPILVHCGGKGKALTFVPSPSPQCGSLLIMKRQSSNHHFQANDITFICRWWDKLESNCLPGTRIRQLYDGLPTDPSSLRHYYYAAATFIGYSCSNIHDCISTVLVLWVYTSGGKFTFQGIFCLGRKNGSNQTHSCFILSRDKI